MKMKNISRKIITRINWTIIIDNRKFHGTCDRENGDGGGFLIMETSAKMWELIWLCNQQAHYKR